MSGDLRQEADGRHPRPAGEAARCLVAGLAGVAVAAALVGLGVGVLHPSLNASVLALPLCAVIAGFVVGVVAGRYAIPTALASAALFSAGGILAMQSGAILAALFAFIACWIAALGALWGSAVRGSRRWAALSGGALVAVFVVCYVVPEARLQWQVARFVRHRLPELQGLVNRDLMALPARRLRWRREPIVPTFEDARGVALSTSWDTSAPPAPVGRCSLSIRCLTLSLADPLGGHVRKAEFSFTPARTVPVSSRKEATALLGSLGVRVPPGQLKAEGDGRWTAFWLGKPDAGDFGHHYVTVEDGGGVTAERSTGSER